MRIQKGDFKGRLVATATGSKGHEHYTPALMKKAVFDYLTNHLGDSRQSWGFLDLCMGSGQMAIEALSLGFHRVEGCELDNKRIAHLVKEFKANNYNIKLHRKDFSRCEQLLINSAPAIFYADPPYSFWQNDKCFAFEQLISRLLKKIDGQRIDLIGMIQGPKPWFNPFQKEAQQTGSINNLDISEKLHQISVTTRRYANQYLGILEFDA